jgi:YD repeat-containing protein
VPECGDSQFFFETTFARDAYGLVSAVEREGSGQVRTDRFAYDDEDHTFPKFATNAVGHTSYFAYHSGLGVLAAVRDANGLKTEYRYDGFGRLRFIDAPDDADVELHYDKDGFGNPRISTYPRGGSATHVYYDRLGRETAREWEDFSGSLVGTEITYDALGRVSSVSRPHHIGVQSGHRYVPLIDADFYEYDNLNRVRRLRHKDGTYQRWEYQGLKARHWDENGNESYLVEDELGRVASSIDVTPEGKEIQTCYHYGPFGLLEGVTDAYGRLTVRMEYDNLGRRYKLVDLNTGVNLTRYNAFHEIIEETDGNGDSTTYLRDALGRVVTFNTKDGETSFTWDTATNG